MSEHDHEDDHEHDHGGHHEHGLGDYAEDFVSNWRTSEGSLLHKVRLLTRNRARAFTRGCCGHPGEPGC